MCFRPVSVAVYLKYRARLDLSEREPPMKLLTGLVQVDGAFEPPPIIECSHSINPRSIIEGNQPKRLQIYLVADAADANTFDHQDKSVQLVRDIFGLAQFDRISRASPYSCAAGPSPYQKSELLHRRTLCL